MGCLDFMGAWMQGCLARGPLLKNACCMRTLLAYPAHGLHCSHGCLAKSDPKAGHTAWNAVAACTAPGHGLCCVISTRTVMAWGYWI